MYPYKIIFHNGQEERVVYFENNSLATLFTFYLFVKHGIIAKVIMI